MNEDINPRCASNRPLDYPMRPEHIASSETLWPTFNTTN